MKNILFYILLCLSLFGATSLVVNAQGSWFDEWLDTYDERNPDNNINYDSFRKDLMYYEGIIINGNNECAFMNTFTNYVITNVDDNSFYLGAIQDGVNAFQNGSLSSKGFVTFLKDVCSYSGINYQSLLKETCEDVVNSKGYFLITPLPSSQLSDIYFYTSAQRSWLLGNASNSKLYAFSINRTGTSSTCYSDDLSQINFVAYNTDVYNSNNRYYWKTLYSNVVSLKANGGFQTIAYYANNTGSYIKVPQHYMDNSTTNAQYFDMGTNRTTNGLAQSIYGIAYNDSRYAQIPIFYSSVSLGSYLSGNNSFYTSDMLKGLDVPDDFDYSRLQNIIDLAIQQGDWVNSLDLQAIINENITSYLEQININTKDILLSLQLGLIDNINNEPYLKQIRDLQIITNEKLDILIELIRNGGIGSGGSGSINLDEVSRRLDTIIELLQRTELPPIDIGQPPDIVDIFLNKFPFSMPNDIYLMVQVLGVQPVKPDIKVGFPIMGSDEVYLTSLDLSWFDEIRPLLFWFIDFGYAIFLLMLSLRMIEGVRR